MLQKKIEIVFLQFNCLYIEDDDDDDDENENEKK